MREGSEFLNGLFALGVVFGVIVSIFVGIWLTQCPANESSLWFCREDPATIKATLDLIQTLAVQAVWPTAIVFLALIFRRSIAELVSAMRISKFRIGHVEAEFSSDLDRAETSTSELPENEYPDFPPTEKMIRDLEVDKSFAVLAAWRDIEAKIIQILEGRGISQGAQMRKRSVSIRDLRYLEIPDSIIATIIKLRSARNRIAHISDLDLSNAEILRFLDIAADIDGYLDRLIADNP